MDDVDDVGAEAVPRGVHARHHAVIGPVGETVHVVSDLGRQQEFLAPPPEVAADALLGESVGARGVDEREPQVECGVQHGGCVRLGHPRIAELHGAEAQHWNGKTRAAERACLHGRPQRSGR